MIFITLGDPQSINIEILAQAFYSQLGFDRLKNLETKIITIGCLESVRQQLTYLGQAKLLTHINEAVLGAEEIAGHLEVLRSGAPGWYHLTPSALRDFKRLSRKAGDIGYDRQERGYWARQALLMAGQIEAAYQSYPYKNLPETDLRRVYVTLPIDKNLTYSPQEFAFQGQTEYFSFLADRPATMLLAGNKLRVGLVSNHLAIRDVAGAISESSITQKLRSLVLGLRDVYGCQRPKIALCGLNPHLGDGGLFGREDIEIIAPCANRLRTMIEAEEFPACELLGPLPADTAFHYAIENSCDAVLAMYHDQGLAPFKLLHFYSGVNITAGLPFLRISPDHGPAEDLFLKKCARPDSLEKCLAIACDYLEQ